ncbi:hypothetical protein EDB84DRAFT_1447369 [Lactarius hengduanensis]|nr:hypothetical protein EDB84DRAFT_1447369 [Lactarius hengduanensis]
MLTLYYHVTITISLFFWVPLRAVRVFCHPHLTAPFTSDLGVPPGRLGGSTFIFVGLPRFVFGGNALYTFPSWMSWDRYSRTLPPPLPSDDLRPPPSYRRRGVVVGCRLEKRKAGQGGSGRPVLHRVLAVERRSICSLCRRRRVTLSKKEKSARSQNKSIGSQL